jgi:hypothetical protein
MSETRETKVVKRSVALALGIVCILLIAVLGGAMAYYTASINDKDNEVNSQKATIDDRNNMINQLNTIVTNLQNQTTSLQKQLFDLLHTTDAGAYYNLYSDEFGNVSFLNPNYNFSPPVSMYHALLIALESEGWNVSSLSGKTVGASLQYVDLPQSGWEGWKVLHEVTQPVENYSAVQANGTTYLYVWDISVAQARYYLVNAATANLVQSSGFPP